MRLDHSEKLLKLIDFIGPDVVEFDLMRLVEGDLQHIGNAILEGKPIKVNGITLLTHRITFNLEASIYSVGKQNEKDIFKMG